MSLDPQLLATGIHHHRAGEFQRALEVYRQLLAQNPADAVVFNLLGAACIDLGQFDQAAAYLADALRLNPSLAAAHDNLGLLLGKQNRLEDAVASLRRAAELDPGNAQTQLNLGSALARDGQGAAAIEAYRRVVQLAPENVRAQADLARLLREQGRHAEALEHFREVMRLKPDSVEACVNLASLHFELKQWEDASQRLRRAIELHPRFAEAYQMLGCVLTNQEKYDEAIEALQTALRFKPEMSDAYTNLGAALMESGRFEAAIENYRQALALQPANSSTWYNLGNAYLSSGNVAAAIEHYDRAIEAKPDYAEAHHNRLASMLLAGKFAEAFPEYERRFRFWDPPQTALPWKFWNDESLEDRTIVLCPEPGFGDTLQFIRYAPLVKQQGARVVAVCNPAQRPILARTPGVDAWITPEMVDFEADCCVRVLSLPHRLKTTLETIPSTIPYVFAEERLIEAWREALDRWDGFKVGIVWQGNPQFPGDRQRSIPLAHFAPLAAIPGVRLVNLQKGPGQEQLQEFAQAWSVIDFGDTLDTSAGAFMDTAAIMKNLDLVITSDTASAHLAGALGVPVWVALQRVPDWRWMLDREDSPWYPTMRLFRQTHWNEWPEVFERMAAELRKLAG